MHAVWDWWLSLWPDHGLIGPALAIVVAAFALLIAGNVVIWTMAGVKILAIGFGRAFASGFRESWRSKPDDPHQELRVVDEGPVDHR